MICLCLPLFLRYQASVEMDREIGRCLPQGRVPFPKWMVADKQPTAVSDHHLPMDAEEKEGGGEMGEGSVGSGGDSSGEERDDR